MIKKILLSILLLIFYAQAAFAAPATCIVTGIVYGPGGSPAANTTVIFSIPQQIIGTEVVSAGVLSTRTDATGTIAPITLPQSAVLQVTVGSGMVVTGVVPASSTALIAQVLTGTAFVAGSAIFNVNGSPTSSQTILNFQNGTNTTATNPSGGNIQYNVSTLTSGINVNGQTLSGLASLTGTPQLGNNLDVNNKTLQNVAALTGTPTTPTLGFTGSGSGTVTVQPQAAAGTYNFNLPTTAGIAKQPLLSGGGAGSPMTWGNPPITSVNVVIFATNGTYTPSSNLVFAHVIGIGGGGGGGSVPNTSGGAAGGGGGGSKVECWLTKAQIGASQGVTVGGKGVGATSPAAGGNGSPTSLGAFFTANGGSGGVITTTLHAAAGGLGGVPTVGSCSIGAYGQQGRNGFTDENLFRIGGAGGPSPWGAGSQEGVTGVTGFNGVGIGSGGGGGYAANGVKGGGDGTDGIVYIIEFNSD